jgi:hypothetical protein
MSLIDKLKELGAVFVEETINANDGKFILGKDATAYEEFLYVLKYGNIPSTSDVEYKKNRFEEVLKFFIKEDFKVGFVRSTYNRWSMETVFLFNDSIKTIIELADRKNNDVIIASDEETQNDEYATITICYDLQKGGEFANKVKEEFFAKKDLSDSGKILLFEKTEYNEMILTPHPIKNYDLDLSENYNDDFLDVHEKIKGWAEDFKSRNNKLVLLHGVPGSGKTNYIKYILNNIKTSKKIYIPPYLVNSMADPAFFPVIKREKESILIIEDAEKILINREDSSDNSVISILLNLCDGIMADVLNFKIIATFNTDEDKIDAALKRKGRMFLKYKFDSLSEEKTKHLFNKIYGAEPPKKRMTLAEIYNDENEFGAKKEEKKSIGFLNV